MKRTLYISSSLLTVILATSLPAQQSARDRDAGILTDLQAIGQSGDASTSTSDEYDEEYGNQEVIGRVSNWEPWRISVRSGVYYTDNAELADTDEESDVFFNLGAGVNYTKQIVGNWFFDAGIRQDFYFYDDNSDLDFGAFETKLGFLYSAQSLGGVQFFTNHHYTRISETNLENSSFNENSIELGALKVFRPAAGHEIYLSGGAEFSLGGDPDLAIRDEYTVLLGYRYKHSEHFNAGLFYRLGFHDYDEAGRDDINHSVSLAVNYELFNDLWLRSSVSYIKNDSDTAGFDYESTNLGTSLALELQF